jgi:hypothetical protein
VVKVAAGNWLIMLIRFFVSHCGTAKDEFKGAEQRPKSLSQEIIGERIKLSRMRFHSR